MNHITNHSDHNAHPSRGLFGASWGEVVRFALVGAIATAIQYVVYLLLLQLVHCGVNVANTVGYVVSFVFNFVASTRYTFRAGHSGKRAGLCLLPSRKLSFATLHAQHLCCPGTLQATRATAYVCRVCLSIF